MGGGSPKASTNAPGRSRLPAHPMATEKATGRDKGEGDFQARSTGIVSVAILCSRLLGLVRDQLLNGLFGSAYAGIFNRAFGTPNMLRDLFAEGALSTAFVTTFSRKIKLEGDAAAWELGRKMATLSVCFMSALTAVGIAIAPIWIRILNPGWDEPAKALCAWLAQVMFPFIMIVSLTALVMGMLNAKRVFFVPAVASAFFSLGCIFGGLALAWVMDPGFRAGKISETGRTAFAIGTLIGGLAQLSVQLPSLKRVGFRFALDFRWKDEGVREVLRLMWPSLIAAGGTQINVLLNAIFASFTHGKESAAAWLGNAQRLQQLPLGLPLAEAGAVDVRSAGFVAGDEVLLRHDLEQLERVGFVIETLAQQFQAKTRQLLPFVDDQHHGLVFLDAFAKQGLLEFFSELALVRGGAVLAGAEKPVQRAEKLGGAVKSRI